MHILRYSWLLVMGVGLLVSTQVYTSVQTHQQHELQTEINYRSLIKQQAIHLWVKEHLDVAQTLVGLLDAHVSSKEHMTQREGSAFVQGVMRVHPHDFIDLEMRWGQSADAVVRMDSTGRQLNALTVPLQAESLANIAPRSIKLLTIQDQQGNHLLRYIIAGENPNVCIIADLNTPYLLESAINTGSAAGLDVEVSAVINGQHFLLHHHASRSRNTAEMAMDSNHPELDAEKAWQGSFSVRGGVTLLIQTWAAPALIAQTRTSQPFWWLAISLLMTLLLSYLVFNRSRFNQHLKRDVAQRTAALHAEQQKLDAVVNHASESILLVDDQGNILLANPAASQLFGYTQEQWSSITVNDLVPADSSVAHGHWMASEMQGERHDIIGQSRDVRGCRQDGSSFPCEVTVNEFMTAGERRFSVVLRDLSAMKLAEIEQQKQDGIRRAIAEILAASMRSEHLKDALQAALRIILDIEGLPLEACGSIFLADDASTLKMSVHQNLSPAVCKACSQIAFGHCLCGQAAARDHMIIKTHLDDDHIIRTDDMVDHGHICAPIHSGDKVLGVLNLYTKAGFQETVEDQEFIATACDAIAHIIQRWQATIYNERLLSIIDTSPDFVSMADASGHVLYVNPAGRKMIGLKADDDVRSHTIEDFHAPEELARMRNDILPAASENDGHYTTELTFLHQCGDEILTRASFSMQQGEDGTPISHSVIAHDIRLERRDQKKIEHTQRLESLGVLAGGIAHDFNNILAVIMGNAALAERKIQTAPEQVQTYINRIVQSSEQAAALCNQMLAYSGQGSFVIEPLDLSTMVLDIIKLLEVSIAPNVVMQYELGEHLPWVNADSAQIQQVIMNLVINASEAIQERSGTIAISTGVMHADLQYLRQNCIREDLPEGSYVYLEVSDNGCGMDDATKERIFEPFFTTKFTGRGLGMSAILGIVRSHRGALMLYSEVGDGTTFKMLLPASESSIEVLPVNNPDTFEKEASGVILIIDDNEAIRDMSSAILEEAGYRVLTADDGLQGVEVYSQHEREILAVLMDMTMPKLNGEACFRELRKINKDVKVILCSGYSEQSATSSFHGKKLAAFIQKPYSPETLITILKDLLT